MSLCNLVIGTTWLNAQCSIFRLLVVEKFKGAREGNNKVKQKQDETSFQA